MIKWLADENFNNHILRGWLRRSAAIDLLRVQDTGLYGANDPAVLDWAAENQRVILTHDFNTMPGYATQRLSVGLPLPGLCMVDHEAPLLTTINDLLLIDAAANPADLENHIWFIPLR